MHCRHELMFMGESVINWQGENMLLFPPAALMVINGAWILDALFRSNSQLIQSQVLETGTPFFPINHVIN